MERTSGQPAGPGRVDDLAVVIHLPETRQLPPSAESLAEVHAEAVIRAAARRAQERLETPPSATRRGMVVSLLCGLALLAIAVWPHGSVDEPTPAPARTVYQHAPSGPSTWDPWVDPFAN